MSRESGDNPRWKIEHPKTLKGLKKKKAADLSFDFVIKEKKGKRERFMKKHTRHVQTVCTMTINLRTAPYNT